MDTCEIYFFIRHIIKGNVLNQTCLYIEDYAKKPHKLYWTLNHRIKLFDLDTMRKFNILLNAIFLLKVGFYILSNAVDDVKI